MFLVPKWMRIRQRILYYYLCLSKIKGAHDKEAEFRDSLTSASSKMNWLCRLCRIVHAILSISIVIGPSQHSSFSLFAQIHNQKHCVQSVFSMNVESSGIVVAVRLSYNCERQIKLLPLVCGFCLLCGREKEHKGTTKPCSGGLCALVCFHHSSPFRWKLDFRILLIASMLAITHSTDSSVCSEWASTNTKIFLITVGNKMFAFDCCKNFIHLIFNLFWFSLKRWIHRTQSHALGEVFLSIFWINLVLEKMSGFHSSNNWLKNNHG